MKTCTTGWGGPSRRDRCAWAAGALEQGRQERRYRIEGMGEVEEGAGEGGRQGGGRWGQERGGAEEAGDQHGLRSLLGWQEWARAAPGATSRLLRSKLTPSPGSWFGRGPRVPTRRRGKASPAPSAPRAPGSRVSLLRTPPPPRRSPDHLAALLVRTTR